MVGSLESMDVSNSHPICVLTFAVAELFGSCVHVALFSYIACNGVHQKHLIHQVLLIPNFLVKQAILVASCVAGYVCNVAWDRVFQELYN